MNEILFRNRMRAKCVTRQLEINKQPAKCIQRDVPHTHHQRHKCNFRFRLQNSPKATGSGSGMGMLVGKGESIARAVSNTMLAQHSARLIAIAFPCLHSASQTPGTPTPMHTPLYTQSTHSPVYLFAQPGTVFEYFIICEYFCTFWNIDTYT